MERYYRRGGVPTAKLYAPALRPLSSLRCGCARSASLAASILLAGEWAERPHCIRCRESMRVGGRRDGRRRWLCEGRGFLCTEHTTRRGAARRLRRYARATRGMIQIKFRFVSLSIPLPNGKTFGDVIEGRNRRTEIRFDLLSVEVRGREG